MTKKGRRFKKKICAGGGAGVLQLITTGEKTHGTEKGGWKQKL